MSADTWLAWDREDLFDMAVVFKMPSDNAGPAVPDDMGVDTAAGASGPKKQSSLFNNIPNALAKVRSLVSRCLPHPWKFRKIAPEIILQC
ncbi:hypothetical protein Y1Q_0022369 [Alligator mississippiensis]|uniref:Uncharacterized protein n=1 Tax=Alligator mississippiensis TaxID=8496 RepID=A0A151MYE2_ALLMI|nr:hypothetical protein Y1Q_0022369 [Alligator mississippiensis]